jgi:TPR repeat protein
MQRSLHFIGDHRMKTILEKLSRYWQLRFLAVGAGVALVVYAVLLPDPGNKSRDTSIPSVDAAPLSTTADNTDSLTSGAAASDGLKVASGGNRANPFGTWLEENHAAADQLGLAVESYHDAEIPRDFSESIRGLRSSAAKGNPVAQFLLGHAYEIGFGVPKDMTETATWYARAGQGHTSASGDAAAQPNPKDFAQAMDLYRKAAEEGDRGAELYMGLAYDLGQDVPKNAMEAAKWYRKAAAQGSASASSNLGILYHEGDGMPRDSVEAAAWFERAAARGSASAQYGLGRMYYRGDGVSQSFPEAAAWLEKAAAQGNAPAQILLSYMCATGRGVAGSTATAYMWINLASATEDQARISRNLIERVMAAPEIAEGQRLTHDWLSQHPQLLR